jgi:imidazolonepropionase-like amidohydrolase
MTHEGPSLSRRLCVAAIAAGLAAATAAGQGRQGGRSSANHPGLSPGVLSFAKVDAAMIALTNARVIDGMGAPPREGQTIIIKGRNIAAFGDTARITPPEGATILDLTGKTVIPGLVMLHEHLFYPTGPDAYAQLGQSFVRLYLAGGVTTLRTGGNISGFMDLKLKRLIDEGQHAGPAIDATAPYLNGPNPMLQVLALRDEAEALRHVDYWADMGATSFKAYTSITRAQLRAAIAAAHRRKLKITGHLCSVTYAEAADLGIDNLEHGFLAATDFVADKKPDACPGQREMYEAIAALDERGAPFQALVKKLIDRKVALTSTLTIFETLTVGRPLPPGLDVLVPDLKKQFEEHQARIAQNKESTLTKLLSKGMALERAFAQAGGQLIAGTDPTGLGGVIPGYANQRQIELLVEAGFTPVEAIAVATRNGAVYLGRDARIGTIAFGKQADLVVIDGDPSRRIGDIRKVETVFKQGLGFDPVKLIDSVRGQVGLW